MFVRRSPLVTLVVMLALAAGAGLVAGACSSDKKRVVSSAVYRFLCEAEARATRGDVEGAARLWVDRVHGPLHPLAADASNQDRVVAGRLLRAKEAVETAWQADPGKAPAGLAELVKATRAAVVTVDGSDPGSCG